MGGAPGGAAAGVEAAGGSGETPETQGAAPCVEAVTTGGGWTGGVIGGAAEGGRRRRRYRARGSRRPDGADLDHGGAVSQHVELRGRGVGQIDDAVSDERSAVVDADHDAAAVLQVRDPHVTGQGQRLVRGGHAVHVVSLAGRGKYLVKARAIPGGDAPLDIVRARGQDIVALAENVVEGRVTVDRTGLVAGDRVGNGLALRRRRNGRRRRDPRGRRGRRVARAEAAPENHGNRCGQRDRPCTSGVHGGVPGGASGGAPGGAPVVAVSPARGVSDISTCCLTAAASSYTAMA